MFWVFSLSFYEDFDKIMWERIFFMKLDMKFKVWIKIFLVIVLKWFIEILRFVVLFCVCLKIIICIIVWKSLSLGN